MIYNKNVLEMIIKYIQNEFVKNILEMFYHKIR